MVACPRALRFSLRPSHTRLSRAGSSSRFSHAGSTILPGLVPRPIFSSPGLYRGDEADDFPGRVVADQLVGSARGRVTAHHLQSPVGAHRQQAQAVAHERRQFALPAFHFGQEVFAEAQQHLVALAAQVQVLRRRVRLRCAGPGLPGMRFSMRSARSSRSRSMASAFSAPRVNVSSNWSKTKSGVRGWFLGAPPLHMAAVQVLPQALALVRRGAVHVVLGDFGLQRGGGLLDERGRAVAHVEPDIDRQDVLLSQPREQPGLHQRGLAQARLAEQDGERRLAHEAQQLGGLGIAAAEKTLRRLVERAQARPGVLRRR